MYLAHLTVEVDDSLVPVEHGRQLEHHKLRLLHQTGQELAHVGGAVGYQHGLGSVLVAACRVEEYHGLRLQLLQHSLSFGTLHLSIPDAQTGQIGTHNFAKRGVALYVCGTVETARGEREVHSESSRQVGHACSGCVRDAFGPPTCHLLLVTRRSFRRTLLHVEMRRIHHPIARSP